MQNICACTFPFSRKSCFLVSDLATRLHLTTSFPPSDFRNPTFQENFHAWECCETKIVRCMKAVLSQKKKSCKNIFTTWTLFICGFTKVWSRAHQPFVNPQINILILKMWPNVRDFISITWLFCSVQTKLTNQKNSHAKKQIYKILSFWGKSFFFSLNKPYSYNSNFYQEGFLQDFTLETKLDFFIVN